MTRRPRPKIRSWYVLCPDARLCTAAQLCSVYDTHERALTPRRSAPNPAPRRQRAELTNALDKLRATRQALEREKSVNAALTAKLTAAANTYRAIGHTFNAVRRGVDEVSRTLSRVEARQGRGNGDGDASRDEDGDGDGDGDPAVAALARLVAECVHRDAFARRRAEALLWRAKRLAARRRGSGSRAAFALARDLRARLDHRESHIVRLTERLVHRSPSFISSGDDDKKAAAAAELFLQKPETRAEDASAVEASASAVAQLAAHRADVLVARAREALWTRLAEARDTEAHDAAEARAEEKASETFFFRDASRFADDADLARVAAERDAALALAERASVGARSRVDATARLLDARNREYVAATRERLARREEKKRRETRDEKRVAAAHPAGAETKREKDDVSPRLAPRRDGAENALPGGADGEDAIARKDVLPRQRRATKALDPFAPHFNSSCES